MARGLKTLGLEELDAFRKRVIRQRGLKRISRPDSEWILARVDELEARIVMMEEKDNGEEDFL